MRIINERVILLRLLVFGILLAMTYPFLPAKQRWQIQAAFGSDMADSLLNEYYEAPVPGALQFSMEHQFQIDAGARRLIDMSDVRYVQIADRVWGEGQLWAIHLRLDAIDRLRDQVRKRPDESLTANIDNTWEIPLDIPAGEVGSPVYIDPNRLSTDPYFVTSFFEPWYRRPYMPPGAMMAIPDYP
jgi:hypothetical protein